MTRIIVATSTPEKDGEVIFWSNDVLSVGSQLMIPADAEITKDPDGTAAQFYRGVTGEVRAVQQKCFDLCVKVEAIS